MPLIIYAILFSRVLNHRGPRLQELERSKEQGYHMLKQANTLKYKGKTEK